MSQLTEPGQTVRVGAARIDLERVQLSDSFVLDELHLEGGDICLEPGSGGVEPRFSSAETRFRAMLSEANLNRLITGSLPPDAPVRGLHVALLSERARISGKALISIVPFPFTIEAVPVVKNGVRVELDCRTATLGVDLPRAVVDLLEDKINQALALDVGRLDFAVWIDEVRCAPGRLIVTGRARLAWPPPMHTVESRFFKNAAADPSTLGRTATTPIETAPHAPALMPPPGDEPSAPQTDPGGREAAPQ